MDFGMPTLIETADLEDCVRLCRALHLNFIELNMNLSEYQIDAFDLRKMKAIAQREGIYFTIHLDENLNTCDFNRRVANAYLDTMMQTIEIAKQLGVPVLNMHLSNGVYFTMPTEKIYLFDRYREEYLDRMRVFRTLCEKQVGNAGIRICVENTCWSGLKFMQEAIDLLLESSIFGLTFDIGHNFSMGGGDEKIIRKHLDRLWHMHAHDAIGKRNHLALGTGELDVKSYLELAEERHCRVVLETKTIEGLKQSCTWVQSNMM